MWVFEFGELGEDFHHFIGTLTAGSDDHDVGFGLLGDGVLQHCLTRTEGTGDEARATLYDGVKGIDGADAGLQELEGTRLLLVVRHGELYGPVLNHVDVQVRAVLKGEGGDGVINLVLSCGGNFLHRSGALHLEGSHDFQRLMVLLDLSEPVAGNDFVADFHDGFEVPEAFAVERVGILTALKEDTLHLIKVILQTIIVLAEHARCELHLEHVACELSHSTHLQAAGALEYLHIDILTDDLDDLTHEAVAACLDVADFTLLHRAIYAERYHVGDNATYCSFCHSNNRTLPPPSL